MTSVEIEIHRFRNFFFKSLSLLDDGTQLNQAVEGVTVGTKYRLWNESSRDLF